MQAPVDAVDGILKRAVTMFDSGCASDEPEIVPIVARDGKAFVGGNGNGVALIVNVTSRLFVPCNAEDGLTLEIWLVTAKAGVRKPATVSNTTIKYVARVFMVTPMAPIWSWIIVTINVPSLC